MSIWFRSLLQVGFALPVDDHTSFEYQYGRHNVAVDASRAAELNPFPGGDVTFNLSADDGGSYLDCGFHFTPLPYDKRICAKKLTVKFPIKSQHADKIESPFGFAAVINDGCRGMIRTGVLFPQGHNLIAF
jgi:hypothetical protein